MVSYNSQVTDNSYKIQIETDKKEYFKLIEDMVRVMIDKSLYESLYKKTSQEWQCEYK